MSILFVTCQSFRGSKRGRRCHGWPSWSARCRSASRSGAATSGSSSSWTRECSGGRLSGNLNYKMDTLWALILIPRYRVWRYLRYSSVFLYSASSAPRFLTTLKTIFWLSDLSLLLEDSVTILYFLQTCWRVHTREAPSWSSWSLRSLPSLRHPCEGGHKQGILQKM